MFEGASISVHRLSRSQLRIHKIEEGGPKNVQTYGPISWSKVYIGEDLFGFMLGLSSCVDWFSWPFSLIVLRRST